MSPVCYVAGTMSAFLAGACFGFLLGKYRGRLEGFTLGMEAVKPKRDRKGRFTK